jgi:N-acetyl-alpha-D-glucosaminyl L-malate synthase BshA
VKIAISCHPTHGGSGVVATELALGLARHGHEIHVVSYERPFRLADHPNLRFHRVNVTEYPLFRYPPHDLNLANKLAQIAEEFDLDLIHAHYAVPHAVSAMLARDMLCPTTHRVSVVTTVHGTDITLVGSHHDFYRVCRYAMIMNDGTTAVSQWLADRTQQEFDLDTRPTVIPNFVDCDRFTSKGRVGYPEGGEFQVLHASNFRPVKRVFDVVRVFERIQRELPARLLLVGDGPELGSAQELVAELDICDRVEFAGTQVDIEQAYRDSHLFLLLSDYESFGVSALEAMACGTPVVASRAGGLVEVIEDGLSGRLCKVGDIDAIADAALQTLGERDTWQRISNAGKLHAREQFCMELIVPRYEEFYEHVLDGQ